MLQQKGTLSTTASGDDPRFLLQILHRPVWLAGTVLQSTGWVVQAMALDRGSLVVVQSLTALSLVLALPLGALLTNQHIGRRELSGAILTVVGIIFFISAGQPQGGTTHPGASAWWSACVTIGVARPRALRRGPALDRRRQGARLRRRGRARLRPAGGRDEDVRHPDRWRRPALLTSWTIYVLILSALSGFVLQQSAFKTGVLAPAMASSNSVTLFSSVILGITVYGETLSKTGTAHAGSTLIGLVVAVVGIALLAGSEEPVAADGPPNRSLAN